MSKFLSRKFLLALATWIIGTVIAAAGLAGVDEAVEPWAQFALVAIGGLLDILALGGYLIVEGKIDAEGVKTESLVNSILSELDSGKSSESE